MLGASSAGLSVDEARTRLSTDWPERGTGSKDSPAYRVRAQVLGHFGLDDRADCGHLVHFAQMDGFVGSLGAPPCKCRPELPSGASRRLGGLGVTAKLRVTARVLRDQAWQVIPAQELVPGDVVRVRTGDFVPADAQIIDGMLQVDQSALTGEFRNSPRRTTTLSFQVALSGRARQPRS